MKKWAVLTYTFCDGWVNSWIIEEDGVTKPQLFDTKEEAQSELDEHILESIYATAKGYMDEPYHYDDYRVEEVEV